MNIVELKNVSFSYGKNKTIDNFSLKIEKGSFTTLLGSSGCGKTTILRLIAGFLDCNDGQILINGEEVNDVQPDKRKIGYVFQDFALFPHMNVYKNLQYGLKELKIPKEEADIKIRNMAYTLQIESLLERYPEELSGGQQQRVALGRALILNPSVLLMDEPLSSLDTKLRIELRDELKAITQKLNITTVYVTHDQEEAMSMSDIIAVMDNGKLIETGTPENLYFKPEKEFTARFTGNVSIIELENKRVMIRPEWMEITEHTTEKTLNGKIISKQFLGKTYRYKIQCKEGILTLDSNSTSINKYSAGDYVSVAINHFYLIQTP